MKRRWSSPWICILGRSVISNDDQAEDITAKILIDFFLQYWTDDRLKFSPAGGKILNHASLKDRVWTPDPFFVNQKEGKVLDNPADNTLFKIKNDGLVTQGFLRGTFSI